MLQQSAPRVHVKLAVSALLYELVLRKKDQFSWRSSPIFVLYGLTVPEERAWAGGSCWKLLTSGKNYTYALVMCVAS